MYYIATSIVFFIVGWVVSYFVMKNNPKYFNIDKMAKSELETLVAKVKEKL